MQKLNLKIKKISLIMIIVGTFVPDFAFGTMRCSSQFNEEEKGQTTEDASLKMLLRKFQKITAIKHRKIASEWSDYLKDVPIFTIGQYFKFRGQEYPIVDLLGSGSEARILLIKIENEEKVIKYFKNSFLQRTANIKLDQLKILGLEVVHVEMKDTVTPSQLMEYVDGIPVDEILNLSSFKIFPLAFINGILKSFNSISEISGSIDTHNVIYEIDTGRLVIIDAE